MKLTTKRTLAAGALVTGLALGGTGIAMAATNAPPAPGATSSTGAAGTTAEPPEERGEPPGQEKGEATETETGTQEPAYTASIPAPPGSDDTGTGAETEDSQASEAEEAKALEALATTTPAEATTAALAAVPGTAGTAELEDENGYVVYSVPVTGTEATTVDVKVDAGNATVLAQDTDNDTETSDD